MENITAAAAALLGVKANPVSWGYTVADDLADPFSAGIGIKPTAAQLESKEVVRVRAVSYGNVLNMTHETLMTRGEFEYLVMKVYPEQRRGCTIEEVAGNTAE